MEQCDFCAYYVCGEDEDGAEYYCKDEYRIFAVRGPRGIPNSLNDALKR